MRVVAVLWLSMALPWGVLCGVKRPHILFFLADDWGWKDVSWSEYPDIPTPWLEKLRGESLELMQFYTQPKCTVARAALMTARYPYKMGLETHDVFTRVRNNTLDPKYKLLPAYFKDLGYHTHMVGKWHLGHCNVNSTPIKKGFDTHFGPWANVEDRFNLTSGGYFDWNWNNEPYWQAQGTYTVHLITNHTQHMLQKHFSNETTKNEPIFLYVPFLVPHTPAMVPERYVTNTSCRLIPKEVPFNNTSNKTNIRRTYCGMVAAMDEGIGNITETLRNLGVIDDFIIFVTSDNGGAVNVEANNYPLRGNKQAVYEGGTRVRALLRAPRFLKEGNKTGEYHGLVHMTDMLPTLLKAAKANLSMLPDDLDGINVWWRIRAGRPTRRKWMIYDIDTNKQLGAIRLKNTTHDFKLIFSNGTNPGEVGYRYQDPRPQSEQDMYPRKRFYRRNGTIYFLYNLTSNPSEVPPSEDSRYPDASKDNKEILELLKRKLKLFTKDKGEIPTYRRLNRKDGHKRDGAWRIAGC